MSTQAREARPEPVTFSPVEPAAVPRQSRFPYIVVRLMSAIYQREDLTIEEGEPCVFIGHRCSYVRHPAPFTDTGEISPGCRELLVQGVLGAVQRGRFRMCLVWARNSCTFCERDGVTRDSNEPPSGGFGSGGVKGTPLPMTFEFDRDPEAGTGDGHKGNA